MGEDFVCLFPDQNTVPGASDYLVKLERSKSATSFGSAPPTPAGCPQSQSHPSCGRSSSSQLSMNPLTPLPVSQQVLGTLPPQLLSSHPCSPFVLPLLKLGPPPLPLALLAWVSSFLQHTVIAHLLCATHSRSSISWSLLLGRRETKK